MSEGASEVSETTPFRCFYECCKCQTKHEGNEHTPSSARMVPGTRPNEWVFVCVPDCQSSSPPSG